MKNGYSVPFLIQKSILKHKKQLLALFLCGLLSFLLVPLLPVYAEYMQKKYVVEMNRECGSFDFGTENAETVRKLLDGTYPELDGYCLFDSSDSTDALGNRVQKVSSVPEILDWMPFELTKGKYPENAKEIACESWMLRQSGVSSAQMLGTSVQLNGAAYSVVGIVTYTSPSVAANRMGTAFLYSENASAGMYLRLKTGVSAQTFEEKMGGETAELFHNVDKEYMGESGDSSFLILYFIFFVTLLSSALILLNLTMYVVEKNRNNLSVFRKLGIAERTLRGNLLLIFGTVLVLSALLGMGILLLLLYGLLPRIVPGNSSEFSASLPDVALLLFYFGITFVGMYFALLFSLPYSSYIAKRIERQKATLRNQKHPKRVYCRLAGNNLRRSALITVLTVLALALSLILMNSVYFWVKGVSAERIDFGDTKFTVSFNTGMIYSEEMTEKRKAIIETLLKEPDLKAEQLKIVYTTMLVDKTLLDSRYVSYLKNNVDFHAAYDNHMKKTVPLPVGITTIQSLQDSAEQEKVRDGEGLLLVHPYNFRNAGIASGKYKSTVEAADLRLQVSDAELKSSFYTNEVFSVLVVSENDYLKYAKGVLPDIIYVHGDVSEEELLHCIPELNLVQVKSVGEIDAQLNSGVNQIVRILISLFAICALFGILTLTVTCLSREQLFRKEYATLHALGVPQKKILQIPLMEFFVVLLSVFLVSVFGTFLISEIIVVLSDSKVMQHMVPFPFFSFGITFGILLLLTAFAVWITGASMKKKSAVQQILKR